MEGCIQRGGCTADEDVPPVTDILIVTNDTQCSNILQTHWSRIVINEGMCNNITNHLSLSNYPNLQSIDIWANALNSIQSLTISNNTQLQTVSVYGDHWYYSLSSATAFVLDSRIVIVDNSLIFLIFIPFYYVVGVCNQLRCL